MGMPAFGANARQRYDRTNWPIAAAMIQYANQLPDGRSVQDQSADEWAATLSEIADAGFTELDPTDCWLRVGDLSPQRRQEFRDVATSLGLSIPAVSTARKNLIDADPAVGEANVSYGHRVIDAAAEIGASAVSFGFFGPLTERQKQVLWFWTQDGVRNPDDPAMWRLAVERVRELGLHAAELDMEVSLEMYEDTYLGTAESAARFVTEVDLPNVGVNADIGNLIRLHRPVEKWADMMARLAPLCRYWHVKNYIRDESADGRVVTHPAPLESGIINYRAALSMVLAHGFNSALLLEHYGGDGLSVCASNRDYLRRILPRPEARA
ncbi:Sugar phosphate isomerase/epimerase [Aureimonas altamirensis DSM 21988]|uniref:Sugar phosphate isomerase/epimerase n=1 Tax=Aureimonas altamirensis DSM 21988 TaxID=1121026 RepID=A0ABY1ID18_9HYPH|nr:sugar phosphate isomerase/epimerase family protein [Aureimonas altamirensis]SHI99254.1 Sugar phosphate isomerase/epimerase [Aureimonas altamirensis DSM 21988]